MNKLTESVDKVPTKKGGIMRDTHNKSLNMLNTIIAVGMLLVILVPWWVGLWVIVKWVF